MGLFDFFKKKKLPKKRTDKDIFEIYTAEPSPVIQKHQAVLNDGTKSLDERNEAYLAIREEEERRLNVAYDFTTVEGIEAIPVPCKEVNGGSATGRVEYYLRGQCFAKYWENGQVDLALACLRKAQELMYVSDMAWKRKDFLRLVVYLRKAGKNEEAYRELERINYFFENQDIHEENFLRNLSSAKYIGTDLMEVFTYSPYCGECAKYVNRLYSISGKDRRFPSLEKSKRRCKHHFACLSFSPFVMGVNEPAFECEDIIKYSNRSFKDERKQDEIKRYEDWIAMMQEIVEKEAMQEAHMLERAKQDFLDTKSFQWLQENLPALCPKSLSGFRRMRTTNSKNYQKLVAEAAKMGKQL